MKSKKLNKNKQTKRVNKTKKNNKNKTKRTKHMKGGAVCDHTANQITVSFTTVQPPLEKTFVYDHTLTQTAAFEDFKAKINTFLSPKQLIFCWLVKNRSAMQVNQDNLFNYCINEKDTESTKYSNKLFCYTMKQFNIETRVQDLLNYITGDHIQMNYLRLISKIKPVATIPSSQRMMMLDGIGGEAMFKFHWAQFSPDEKQTFIKGLRQKLPQPDLNLGINYSGNGEPNSSTLNDIIFYSIPDFNRLCRIFDYTEEEGFNVLRGSMDNDNKKLLFMWISFGNLTSSSLSEDIPNETTNFRKFSKNKIMLKGRERSYQSLFVEYLQNEGDKYNSRNIYKDYLNNNTT
jgi:hypothetical protein